MTTDYRALCAELADALNACLCGGPSEETADIDYILITRAREILAQPEPAADGEAAQLVTLIRQIALAWEPDACLLGNMTAGQLARAADLLERLAQPEPVGPTDEEMEDLADAMNVAGDPVPAMRRALELWGRPALTPIPVSERLPGADDCDAEGRCWVQFKDEDDWMPCWQLSSMEKAVRWAPVTHWLPHHAIAHAGQPAADA